MALQKRIYLKYVKSKYKNTKCFGFVDVLIIFCKGRISHYCEFTEGLPYVILESINNH